jgi:Zn-dependent protease with chaperone function
VGADIAAGAGYDPEGAQTALEKLGESEPQASSEQGVIGKILEKIADTHPELESRLDALG